jgi:hypothetical protein
MHNKGFEMRDTRCGMKTVVAVTYHVSRISHE